MSCNTKHLMERNTTHSAERTLIFYTVNAVPSILSNLTTTCRGE